MSTRPRLRLSGVLFQRRGRRISADFRTGTHALVIPSIDLAQHFVECAGGTQQPLWGKIRLHSKNPFRSPQLRARIGTARPFEPQHTSSQSVASFLEQAAHFSKAVNESPAPAHPLLDSMLDRTVRNLNERERRRLALSLALALPDPVALILDDPLADLSVEETHWVLGELDRLAELETIVICITRTRREGLLLSRRLRAWGSEPVGKTEHTSFSILCSDPGTLAKSFVEDPHVIETRLSTEQPLELIVTMSGADDGATALTRCLAKQASEIFQVTRVAASLVPQQPIAPAFPSPGDGELFQDEGP